MLAVVSVGAVGATGTRTVTRTLASVVPPSPLAVRWKLVELEGETVWVPFVATSPMPSMVTTVAFWVRQLRTTDWPRSMARGSAVMLAVGAGVGAGVGGGAGATAGGFFWGARTGAMRTRVEARIVALRNLIVVLIVNLLLSCSGSEKQG